MPCFLCFEKSDIFIWHFACMSWGSYLHLWNWIVLARICLRIDWCAFTFPDNFLRFFNVYIWVSFYISGNFSGIRVLNINSVPLCFFLFQWLWLYVCYSFFACLLFHCFPSDPFHFFLYVIFILFVVFLYFLNVPLNFHLSWFSLEYFNALLYLLFIRT